MTACLVLLALIAGAADKNAAIVSKNDVVYAEHDGEKLRLDFVAPKAGGPHPCVVCIHGGAWKGGSRKELSEPLTWADFGTHGKSLLDVVAEHGFAGASISYRLAPKSKFPAQIIDVKTAIRYLKANATPLNIDPERIAVLGYSAGGHLASLAATCSDVPEFEGTLYPKENSKVKCVVDFFGPSDLTLYADTPGLEKSFMIPLLGVSAADKPEVYKKASPLYHVDKNDPPFLIIHGTADIVVPMLHSERLQRKLKESGVPVELIPMKGKGHGWFGEDMAQSSRDAAKFLNEHLKAK